MPLENSQSPGEAALLIPFLIKDLESLSKFGTLRVLEEDKSQTQEQKWEAAAPGKS